jgi:hypothetical protein
MIPLLEMPRKSKAIALWFLISVNALIIFTSLGGLKAISREFNSITNGLNAIGTRFNHDVLLKSWAWTIKTAPIIIGSSFIISSVISITSQ